MAQISYSALLATCAPGSFCLGLFRTLSQTTHLAHAFSSWLLGYQAQALSLASLQQPQASAWGMGPNNSFKPKPLRGSA